MEEKDAGATAAMPHAEASSSSSMQEASTPHAPTASPAMIARVRDYVGAVAARMLFEAAEPDDNMAEALKSKEATDVISRFIADARVPVLYFETSIPTGIIRFDDDDDDDALHHN